MAAKRKSGKRTAKRGPAKRGPAKRKATARRGSPAKSKGSKRSSGARAKPSPKRPAGRAKPAAKRAGVAGKGVAARPAAVPVSAFSLELVQVEPLRYEAAAALGRLETVELRVGTSEDGARVETLVFSPSGNGVQSLGQYVHRGEWNGTRLLTDKGHLLDVDGCCFCRDCEAAGGFTVDDDE